MAVETKVSTPTDLRDWLKRVDALGELQTVRGANTEEDIGMATELLGRTRPSKATLFDEIKGFRKGFRVLANGLGSFSRIAVTLGLDPNASPHELVRMWQERVRKGIPSVPAEIVKDGPVFEKVMRGDQVDCLIFPAPKWHEFDGGRYLGTGSFDITRDPDDGWINLGTYRVMVHDKKRLGFYISPGKHGRQHRDKWFARGGKMPVAFVAGGDPLLFWAACTEIKYGLTEYDWAGGVRGYPYRVVKGPVTGLPLPADAEIVIEGWADPKEMEVEGPFGEWTGYYASMERPEPVMHVEAIDPMNLELVMWAICTRSEPAESIDIIPRMWSGPLDPRIQPGKKGFSSRAIIDATRPFEWRDQFPRSQQPTPEWRKKAMDKWGWLLGEVKPRT